MRCSERWGYVENAGLTAIRQGAGFTTDYTDLYKTIFNRLITNNIYLCNL
ncbi:hypothetical protein M079_3366 [Bacteroides fragilis str. 3996 N(B) 6]|nr:hypothetical protein M079_3366 [Bacteroides fragilis str. 3996 N(B) 6]EXY94475.1 hypothetical protein M081_3408 [Bacteroides fragilis str. 3998 T(B) 4]